MRATLRVFCIIFAACIGYGVSCGEKFVKPKDCSFLSESSLPFLRFNLDNKQYTVTTIDKYFRFGDNCISEAGVSAEMCNCEDLFISSQGYKSYPLNFSFEFPPNMPQGIFGVSNNLATEHSIKKDTAYCDVRITKPTMFGTFSNGSSQVPAIKTGTLQVERSTTDTTIWSYRFDIVFADSEGREILLKDGLLKTRRTCK